MRKEFIILFCFLSFISKAQHQMEWVKSIGGNSVDFLNKIITDENGSIYAVGYFNGNADYDPSNGSYVNRYGYDI